MSQRHLDRLSAIDAAFLAQESPSTHMHIGGIARFEGEPPAIGEFLAHIGSRLHLVPRYRQKLAIPPLETGRPVWVDDPTFNLEYHVRHTALPAPGSESRLLDLTARIFSQPLDRTKPLWELWLVEGVEGDSFAMISKTHHALVDGIAGLDLTTVLFDLSPDGPAVPPAPTEPWIPQPEPSAAALAAAGLTGAARAAIGITAETVAAATHPSGVLGRVRDVALGVGEVALTALDAPPATPFNVPPGGHRRVAVVRAGLDELRAVKDAFGGTVNDVVLAVVAGALRFFLEERGQRTDEVVLRACVPVSVRATGDAQLGNQLTQILAPLPVGIDDPVERLRRVSVAMRDLKASKQAVGAKAIAAAQGFAPPTILAQASRMNFSDRFYNLLVTNVPGPQFPLFVLGRRLDAMFPVAFLAGDRALAVAIMSYDGGMNFGLIGDYDAVPDLGVIAEGIEGSLAELTVAAKKARRAQSRKAGRRPVPTPSAAPAGDAT